ncbi:NAD-dependent epimerase/dehydratase family protein, partial [bacterium]
MRIIVTGSLGHISKPLTEELIEKGHTVVVISSNSEKQKDIEALGATPAIGSLEDHNFLSATFTGADAVYAMIPPNFSEPDMRQYYNRLGNNYAQAVKESGIKRLVHLSSYGAHLDKGTGIILGAHDVEQIFNKFTDVKVTHLRPTYFYYNLYAYLDMIKQTGFIGSNFGGDDKLLLVAPEDIAIAAAEEIQKTDNIQKTRYIGSDELTASEVASVLGAAIGKTDLKWVTFTDEQAKSAFEGKGMPSSLASDLVDLGASIHSGAMQEDYLLNKPTVMGKVK